MATNIKRWISRRSWRYPISSRAAAVYEVAVLCLGSGNPYVCGTLDQEEWAEYSDHAAIIATFEADSPGSEG
jgi:hypothetical protein